MDGTDMTPSIRNTIDAALCDAEVGWSMGSFGALAEFHQDLGEEHTPTATGGASRATARGAISLDEAAIDGCTPVAYEQLSKNRERWGQGLALCMPSEKARGARRNKLTRLGPDPHAIRDEDRGAQLYDMGLDLQQCDFCIRTRDADLIAVLDANDGRSLFEAGNPAMGAILKHHPHRVAITPLGRVEVFQKIGGPDTGGKSPPGPHTHVLPNLMRAKKTHAANITLPSGLVPCAYLHPGNPLVDGLGQPRDYREDLARAFASLYAQFAPDDLRSLKSELRDAINAGHGPDTFAEPETRAARLTLRVGLRQLAQAARADGDTDRTAQLQPWLVAFDGADRVDEIERDEQAEHG